MNPLCALCTEDLFTPFETDKAIAFPCGHVFHQKCSETWVRLEHGCIECKASLDNSNDIKILHFSVGDTASKRTDEIRALKLEMAAAKFKSEEMGIGLSYLEYDLKRSQYKTIDYEEKVKEAKEAVSLLKTCLNELNEFQNWANLNIEILKKTIYENQADTIRLSASSTNPQQICMPPAIHTRRESEIAEIQHKAQEFIDSHLDLLAVSPDEFPFDQ